MRSPQPSKKWPDIRAHNAGTEMDVSALPSLTFAAPNGGEVRAAATVENGARVVILAYSGGEMTLRGWPRPVVIDLTGMEIPEQVALLADHDNSLEKTLGQGTGTITNNHVFVEGSIIREGKANERVLRLSKGGFKFQASVGAPVLSANEFDPGETVEVNDRTFTAGPRGLIVATKTTLREVSILGLGADDQTTVSIAARAAGNQEDAAMDFAQWLKAKGHDEATLTPERRTELEAAWKAETAEPAPVVTPAAPVVTAAATTEINAAAALVTEMRETAAAESTRIAMIRAVCAGKHAEIEAKAISENWNEDKTNLEVLRATRAAPVIGAPAVQVGSLAVDADNSVLEAAFCLRNNIGDDAFLLASYGQETLNKADRFRTLGLTRMMEIVAARSGVDIPLDTKSTDFLRAAFSTVDLPGIVGNVANKALAAAFNAGSIIAPLISAKRSHGNFHTHTVYSLAMNGNLELVAPSGELQHMELSEESWTRKVETRGTVLRITRTDLINDELGAFLDNANKLGRKSATSRERVLFTALNATALGSSFFTAANSNYLSGAGSALALAGLDDAVAAFRDQTGPDGDPVMIEPQLLLVPTGLEATAKALMNSQSVVVTGLASTSAESLGPLNQGVWAGSFTPLTSPWLANSNLTGYSATAWYLLAAPNDVPAMEIAYLNGVDTPTINFFGLDSDVNTLGVSWRCFYDFGVALAEYRAGVKSAGV